MTGVAYHRGFSADKRARLWRWKELRPRFFMAVRHMLQKDAADLIGVTPRAYVHYVTGDAVPTNQTMDRIEEYLHA